MLNERNGFNMARDFKKKPMNIFSCRGGMKRFTDGLNNANIFNEKIPYLVIHRGEKRRDSELEIKLTFKDDVISNLKKKTIKGRNKEIIDYIYNKLKEVPDFHLGDVYTQKNSSSFLDMLDPSDAIGYAESRYYYPNPKYDLVCNSIVMIDKTNNEYYRAYSINASFLFIEYDFDKGEEYHDQHGNKVLSIGSYTCTLRVTGTDRSDWMHFDFVIDTPRK